MNCTEHRNDANAFIDGRLEAEHYAGFFKHLGQCPDCQSFMDVTIRMREAARREQIAYPPELDDAVLSNLISMRPPRNMAAQPIPPRFSFWKKRFAMPASVIAAAAIVLLILGFSINVWLNREQGGRMIPAAAYPYAGQLPAQPTKIIVVYSLPPVEVHGTASFEPTVDHKQVQY